MVCGHPPYPRKAADDVQDRSNLNRLVDGDVIDLGLSPIVVGGIRNRVGTCSSIVVDGTGPVATDANVDDEAEVAEGGCDVARLVRPQSSRSSPSIRVGITALDVLGDLVPFESPDSNVRIIPKRGKDTASSHVEGGTSASLDIGEGATSVVVRRAHALSRDRGSKEALVHRAVRALVPGGDIGVRPTDSPAASVKSVLVHLVSVDVFDDVNLPAIWPFRANSPECWPDRGTMSKLPEISDHESAIVSGLAGDTDRSSIAARGNGRLVVDLNDGGTVRLDVGKILGVLLGFVYHVSMSWIRLGEEIPSVKEGLALVLILKLVLGSGSGNVVMS